MSLEPPPVKTANDMSFALRVSLQATGDSVSWTLALPSPKARRTSTKRIMLSRYLKDKQRHEMLACNSAKPFPKKESKAAWRNLNRVLPDLAGLGAWCQRT
ncbi:hypothetical protein VTL71DRAFT_13379 [Oculimacula yallundae]|uniref:Uncharacterized protein n=1 Tax=Oculimacula yallundae TaxID=86028 RepID=A0ABR4CK71_9HELO